MRDWSGYNYDSHTTLQLESKDQICARGVPSPDEWDAVALTFAEPVRSTPSNFNREIERACRIGASARLGYLPASMLS